MDKNDLISLLIQEIPDDAIIEISKEITKPADNSSLYGGTTGQMIVPSFTEEGEITIRYRFRVSSAILPLHWRAE